jgi:hypothetical protein
MTAKGADIDTTGKNVDEILDNGTPGLQYWIQLAGHYEKAAGTNGSYSKDQLLALYDQQRGLDVKKLEAAGEGLEKMLKVADEQGSTQRSQELRMESLWKGIAAEGARYMFNQQLTLSDADREQARKAMTAIKKAVGDIRGSVERKAEMTLRLLGDDPGAGVGVGGDRKSPDDVGTIISGANMGSVWFDGFQEDTILDKLKNIFPDLDAGNSVSSFFLQGFSAPGSFFYDSPDSPFGKKAKERCQQWLDKVFKPEYERNLKTYVDACHLANTDIEGYYKNLTGSLEPVYSKYPRPTSEKPSKPGTPSTPGTQTTPTSTTPTAPTSTTPTSTTPTSTTPTSTTPTSTTPTPTTPTPTTPTPTTPTSPTPTPTPTNPLQGLASLSQVASQLSPLATSLAQSVGQGLTALGSGIKDGVDKALEEIQKTLDPKQAEDKNGDGKPDEKKDGKPAAEFDLAGKHVKFEMGADGQLKAVVTDADGKTHEYGVKLDESGKPVISTDEPKNDDPKGEAGKPGDKPSTSEGTPAPGNENPGQSGSVPGVPTRRPEDDGEHKPNPMPVPGAQEAPQQPDSGAELAEAGPL